MDEWLYYVIWDNTIRAYRATSFCYPYEPFAAGTEMYSALAGDGYRECKDAAAVATEFNKLGGFNRRVRA